eukprot:COSAG02_NODE_3863_length_6129_cov_2.692869_4_plen_726_part_00
MGGLAYPLLVLALLVGVVHPQYLNAGLLDDAQPARTRVGGQRLLTQPPAAAAPVQGAQGDLSVGERAQLERERMGMQREALASQMASRRDTAKATQPAAGWRDDSVPEASREKQQQTYEQHRGKRPDPGGIASAMAGSDAVTSLADRRAVAAERLAAVRAQNADRQKNRANPHVTPPPPPVPSSPPPSPRVSTSGWYHIDDGGSVAFRSSPNMESRTSAIAQPNDLVYAAREPEQFPGWIQTDEGLWLPKTYLIPVAVPPSDMQMERAHATHSALAEAAENRESTPEGRSQPPQPPSAPPPRLPPRPRAASSGRSGGARGGVGWYRVDDGGSVAFRKSPSIGDRTAAVANANDFVYMARSPPEHAGWLQTDEGLWLPTQFLVQLGPHEQPTDAEQEAAHEAHSVQADRAFDEGQSFPPLPQPSATPPPPRRLQQEEKEQVKGDECVDSDWKCGTWAQAGECEKDADFMTKNCRLACGLCAVGNGAAVTDEGNAEMERLYAAEAAKLAAAGGSSSDGTSGTPNNNDGMAEVTQQLDKPPMKGDGDMPKHGGGGKLSNLSELKATASKGLESDPGSTQGAVLESVVPQDPAISRAARKLESFQGTGAKPKPVLRITSPAKQDVIFTRSANANDDAANTTTSVATVPVTYNLDGGAPVSLGPQVGGGVVSVCVTLDKAPINGWKGGNGQTISRQAQLFFDSTSKEATRAVDESCFVEHSTLSLPNLGW